MCVSVTVLSTRTVAPVSTPAVRAASSKPRPIRSQVPAPIEPMPACNADLPGAARDGSNRANRRAESESANSNANPR